MTRTTEYGKPYEVRTTVTPEVVAHAGLDIVALAEEDTRQRLERDLGPELFARAKLWWEIIPWSHLKGHPPEKKPRRRWNTWERGIMFPRDVYLLHCVMQVVNWYEPNPLIYGFRRHEHDWPDFRCDDCGTKHPRPLFYCPVCGETFADRQMICMHTGEDDAPPRCLSEPVPPDPEPSWGS